MDIDSDTLGIPETEYEARVTMSFSEFTRIVRDLSQLGESVKVSKEGVRFSSEGEASGSVLLQQAEGAAISGGKIMAAKEGTMNGEKEVQENTSEKKEKKPVKEKSDDVRMVDEDEDKEYESMILNSNPKRMTTKARKTKRMKKSMRMRVKVRKEAAR